MTPDPFEARMEDRLQGQLQGRQDDPLQNRADARSDIRQDGYRSSLRSEDYNLLLRDLRVFHEVARAITSALDRDSIIQAIVSQMESFFRPRSWSLLLVDEAEQCLAYAVIEGRPSDKADPVRIPVGEGMAGWVAVHGEPLIVPQIDAFANAAGSPEMAGRLYPAEMAAVSFKVESAITIPLRSRGRTLGVLQLFNYRLEALTDYAMTFLHILADYAGIAIENARALERIQELTITDDCTRLFNTRHLHAALQTEFERSRRFNSEFSLIFMDLDHFKLVNDEHGHLIGTELLVEVAQLVQQTTRAVDTVFRYGGDEFVVLLPQTAKTAAVDVAQRLRLKVRSTEFLRSRELKIKITASFGISTYPHDGVDSQAILHAADTLMYSVKKSSRDDVAVA
jgi:diguanylate cyclase (GGDEF)-like protein